MKSGQYTDLTLRLSDGGEFNVHRAVLVAQSEYFAAALKDRLFQARDLQISTHSATDFVQ